MKVAKPINQARATYVMDTVEASHEDFNEIVASFYLHLLRHTRSIIDPVDMAAVGAEGLALLERTYAKEGGYKGALAEAKHATNGGVRFILDSLTQKFFHEQQEKYIDHVLRTAMDPLDWDGKVKLIKAISPNSVVSTTQIGLAMINSMLKGYDKKILKPKDIIILSGK